MIDFEKKIEEDFEELKKILVERYPNNLMEKKVIDLLKRVHKSIWALQVSSSSFSENVDSILISALAFFEMILIKNPISILVFDRNIIENIIYILAKKKKEFSEKTFPNEIFRYLLEKSLDDDKLHYQIEVLKDKYSKLSLVIHNKNIKKEIDGAVDGMNQYWKFYTIEELETAVNEYILIIQNFITIIYLENTDNFPRLSENSKGIITNFLTKKQIKDIKNIID
jgi:hypothetical protein